MFELQFFQSPAAKELLARLKDLAGANITVLLEGETGTGKNYLDEKKFRRLGGLEEIEVDFQLVSATNTNLKRAAEQGDFRLDLFFRISTAHLLIPPLRNRPDDILSLAQHFIAENNKAKDHVPSLSKAAKETLLKYPWPGNIRELKNVMQIATRFAKGKEILPEDFTWVLQEWNNPDEDQSLATAEWRHIAKILKQYGYHRAQTAKALKITETTLRSKIRKYGL